jgi:hypothetical protein
MRAQVGRYLLALLVLAAACKETIPTRADDPTWFAAVHAGKDMGAVRARIDEILEKDPNWSRGVHGLKAHQDGRVEGIACMKLDPERFEVRCEEDSREHCQLDFTLTDREIGEDNAIENLTEGEAQELLAMMLRFCGLRDPGEAPPADEGPDAGTE